MPFFTQYTQPSSTAYLGLGAAALLPAFIASFFQQGLAEEFLFRGFLNKRLIRQFGFPIGNIVHALLFAGMHILFSSSLTFWGGTITVVTTCIGGYLLGYLSEKSFDGSILPAVFLHGLGNFIICAVQAYQGL